MGDGGERSLVWRGAECTGCGHQAFGLCMGGHSGGRLHCWWAAALTLCQGCVDEGEGIGEQSHQVLMQAWRHASMVGMLDVAT